VYTYVGDIVVSVNPFKNTGCYGKAIRAKFKGGVRRTLPPHIYALVEHAYGEMNRNQFSQSILISGESGAGKTEAMKICLTFICEVSVQKGQKVSDEVAIRLMQTNPVMEALGNAKTIRNNNSSRFGKHFDVQFSQNGAILGAFTSTYLLEKPRITQHMTGERNYHVFYMLCKAPRPVREPVGVTQWQDYAALNQKGTIEKVETWDDQKEFEDMHEAYCKLGFSEVRVRVRVRVIGLGFGFGLGLGLGLDARGLLRAGLLRGAADRGLTLTLTLALTLPLLLALTLTLQAQRTELYVMLAFVMTLWNVSFVLG
jgi:myosin heavy subunit